MSQIKRTLPLLALILATLACTMGTQTTEPEDITPPALTITQQDEATEEATEESIEEIEEINEETGTSSNNTTAGNIAPPPAVLPSCVPRTDWTATYTVVAGDTLASIARRTGTDFRTLASANCLADANAIEVGQVLRVPTVVAPSEPDGPAITITQTVANTNTLTVRGNGGGLFENGLVVELYDANNRRLRQQPITINTNEMGGSGPWEATLDIADLSTDGYVRAYAISARDGSVIAEDRADITLNVGDSGINAPNITITQTVVGSRTLTARGNGGGLFENGLVVELYDASNRRLRQQPITINTNEMGGSGSWEVTLDIADLSTNGDGYVRAYALSARDGSVIAEDRADVSFDTTPSIVRLSLQWSEWDTLITPDPNGRFPMSGYVQNGGNLAVRVSLRDNTGNPIDGLARSTTTQSGGYWTIPDITVPAEMIGDYQLVAEVFDADGDVLDTALELVTITENADIASNVYTFGAAQLVAPQGWFNVGDAGVVGFATHGPPNVPPGAAYNEHTMTLSAGYNQDASNTTVADVVDGIRSSQSQAADFTETNVTLDDGTQAVYVRFTSGTGRLIHQMVFETADGVMIVTGFGREDVILPLMYKTRRLS